MTQNEPLTIYCECTPVVDAKHEADSGRSIGETLVAALAEAVDIDVTELPPLYGTIDLDAVAQLFDTYEETADSALLLGFEFENWKVYVGGDGRIRICDTTESTVPTPVFEDFPVGAGTSPQNMETG